MSSCIHPEIDLKRWEVCCNDGMILANADWYFTKEQTIELIDSVSGMSPTEVQDMINRSIHDKAEKYEVQDLADIVSLNTWRINQCYTKSEITNILNQYVKKEDFNSYFANYAKVEGTTLILNAQNIH